MAKMETTLEVTIKPKFEFDIGGEEIFEFLKQ